MKNAMSIYVVYPYHYLYRCQEEFERDIENKKSKKRWLGNIVYVDLTHYRRCLYPNNPYFQIHRRTLPAGYVYGQDHASGRQETAGHRRLRPGVTEVSVQVG